VSYPPYPPGADPNRPQDTPRSFPTYARPEQGGSQGPYQQNPYPAQGQYPQQGSYSGQQGPHSGQAPYSGQQGPYAGQQGPYAGQQGPYSGQQAPYAGQPYQQTPYQQQNPYPAPGFAPAQYGYGYGYPGTTHTVTNGLATAAMICGLAAILFAITAPVGVGLGIAALVQIKRRNQNGTGQAIAGIVVGGVISLFWIAVIAFAVTGDYSDTDYGRGPVSSSSVYVEELAVGECFDDASGEDEVYRRSCAEPHDGEITGDVTMAAGPYPGDDQAAKTASAMCDAEFGTYVGKAADKSELESTYWHPTEDTWDEGDRLVVCAAYGPDGDLLTGTVKGSKR
jgi:hypothetical protein